MPHSQIELRGVRVHNLKHVDLDIPHRQLVAFCGVSGSGKTSLALDTLYTEGQRRYLESFSASTRQFLEPLGKPDADRIDGLPPAIAVTHSDPSRASRSTVGVATEVNNYLRLLFARMGQLHCDQCQQPVHRDSPTTVTQRITELAAGTRIQVAAPFTVASPIELAGRMRQLREAGFARVIVGNRTLPLTTEPSSLSDPATRNVESGSFSGYVVVDRLVAGDANLKRTADSVETAFQQGDGRCSVLVQSDPRAGIARQPVVDVDGAEWSLWSFTSLLRCESCGLEYSLPDARCHNANSRIAGRNLTEVEQLAIAESLAFFRALAITPWERQVGRFMLDQVVARLGFLEQVGLGYLSLDRPLRTLSSGEAQRVALTSTLGSSLVNMLYVLDEPSVGLHPSDVEHLVIAVQALRDRGNSVILVEHEESMLRAADRIIEIGPNAGERGGEVTFQGTHAELLASLGSLTGDFLSGRRVVGRLPNRRNPTHGWIKLVGASGHNLKQVDVDFPLGVLCLVTGVSGAGKSTLVQDTLYGALRLRKRQDAPQPLAYKEVYGDGQIDDVILIDSSPIGRTPRSNPVTYVKAFDEIRQVFAETVDARIHNYAAGHFSFNIDGGRCPTCRGDGYIEIDMQFLANVFMKCGDCHGTRYRKEILDVRYRGFNIAEVLNLTVREAFSFFRGQRKVQEKLKQLIDVGLDYLRLGQPATTLSTGEAQRLKLATHLASATRSRTLFLLDEPTTGLHFSDIVKLLDCFEALLAGGHSLLIVEHNLQLMKAADYIIDLGPGAAENGGRVVVHGVPEHVAQCAESLTGRFLAESLVSDSQAPSP